MVEGHAAKKGHGTPTLSILRCPVCGGEVEMFSTDPMATCETCGKTVFNESNTCIRYCIHAEECWGKDLCDEFKRCVEKEEGAVRQGTD